VIHPFSGNPKRNLPLASWAEITAALAAKQLKIFVNANQAEKDLFLAAVPAATASFHFACDHSASLRDLAYVISRAEIFVGNNSGPLHLASALNTPCVGIYERREVHYIEPRGVRPPRLLIFENSPEEIKAADVTGEIIALLGTA
jgi:ADP-heptose:LPS heptosyltransferase